MRRRADNRFFAHLAYTSLFEKTVASAVSTTASYATMTVIRGAAGAVTVNLPTLTLDLLHTKAAFHLGVINEDGNGTVTLATTDGHTINGGATVVLPATAGANAIVMVDLTSGQWIALVAPAGGSFVAPPTYTAKGPASQYDITTTPTAIPDVSITTAPFTSSQKAIVTYSVTVRTDAGQQDDNTFRIFDGVVGSSIDAFIQTAGNSAVDANPFWNENSYTLEVPGNGSARTFGLGVSGTNAGAICHILAGACRGVVQIVDG